MLSPSAIQRADDFVGMEMPMVPLSAAKAWGVNDIRLTVNAVIVIWINFIFSLGDLRSRTLLGEVMCWAPSRDGPEVRGVIRYANANFFLAAVWAFS